MGKEKPDKPFSTPLPKNKHDLKWLPLSLPLHKTYAVTNQHPRWLVLFKNLCIS